MIGNAWLAMVLLVAALPAMAQSANTGFAAVNDALQAGQSDKALGLLTALPQDAEWHNLDCRIHFALEHWDTAVSECGKAVAADRQNSNYHMWLGRALGEKASRASFMSAYGLGKRVRGEFEEAVRLNPKNAEALADLGEFYYSAPGIVGGGSDKAANVASQLDQVDPARAHELRARTAEQNKDYGTAEREFKQALAVSQHPAYQWVTLAAFYGRRQRWNDLDAAIQNAVKAAPREHRSGVALYNGASVLIRANRNPELAVKMLTDYLSSNSMTEEGPAFVARTRLAKLKAQLGDKTGARQDRDTALALAHDYRPAQELKF
jgi:tetratricopeptide (TPR) repeat protein